MPHAPTAPVASEVPLTLIAGRKRAAAGGKASFQCENPQRAALWAGSGPLPHWTERSRAYWTKRKGQIRKPVLLLADPGPNVKRIRPAAGECPKGARPVRRGRSSWACAYLPSPNGKPLSGIPAPEAGTGARIERRRRSSRHLDAKVQVRLPKMPRGTAPPISCSCPTRSPGRTRTLPRCRWASRLCSRLPCWMIM